MKNDVLARGTYNHSQAEGYLNVGQYMFVVNENKKYVALRFINNLGHTVESFEACVQQLDSDGNLLSSTKIVERKLSVAPSETFTLRKNPELSEKCSDIRVYVSNVISGNYRYEQRGDRVVAFYSEKPSLTEDGGADALARRKYRRYKKTARRGAFISVAVAAAIFLLAALNAAQMAYEYGAFEELRQKWAESKEEAD